MGAPVRAADRSMLEDTLATTRMVLGAAAYGAAWTAGESLPLGEAISLALEDTHVVRRGR
jgi:hypothetical protein